MAGLLEMPWRRATTSGIPYRVVSVSGDYSDEEATVREEYIIESYNLMAFIIESFPTPYTDWATGNLIIPPRRPLPGYAVLRTRRISFEAFTEGRPVDPFVADINAPADTYEGFLKLTIEYATSKENDEDPTNQDPRTFLEITANASGEFLHTPARSNVVWEGEAGEDDEEVREMDIPQTVVQPETEWSVRWSQIPFGFMDDILIGRLRNKLGKVNSTPMNLLFSAPEETILFLGYNIQQQFTWRENLAGQPPMILEFKFLEKRLETSEGVWVGHNHFYRPGVGWRRMLIDGHPAYASTNLDNIFVTDSTSSGWERHNKNGEPV